MQRAFFPKFKKNVLLSRYSNYKIGGPARYFFTPKDLRELRATLAKAREENLRVFILGGGTNLLIHDRGWDGLVVAPRIMTLRARDKGIEAGAGVQVAELLKFAARKKLSGLEWAGGLPGTVGGAIRGNAGCFGSEMKDRVSSVTSMDVRTGKVRARSRAACKFGYRTSIFKKEGGKEIILGAVFALKPGDPKTIRSAIKERINSRRARHPLEYPNIGSIFKNVPLADISPVRRKRFSNVLKTDPFPVVPAAYLISEAGLKGMTKGGAMVSPKHPNFIVNALNASAEDVRALIALVKQRVYKKFRIKLEEEVIIL